MPESVRIFNDLYGALNRELVEQIVTPEDKQAYHIAVEMCQMNGYNAFDIYVGQPNARVPGPLDTVKLDYPLTPGWILFWPDAKEALAKGLHPAAPSTAETPDD